MPSLKITKTRGETLVAICDAELFGKEFKEGKLRLKIEKSFYGGREASVKECLEALRQATIANLVGSIVEHAIQAGFVDRANVIKIQKVPHAQFVRF